MAADRRSDKAAAAVIAARSPLVLRFFTWYFGRFVARSFHGVRLSKVGEPALPPGRPAVVYANHPSWWDPVVFVLLAAARFPGRPGYGPMEAAQLRRYGFMRRLGIFGIAPGTHRGAADFLRISRGLLTADPQAMLWVTAEGAFTDARQRPVRLRPGLAHLARRLPDAVLVPLALEYVFWDERFPELLLRFGPPLATAGTAGRSVAEWQALLERHLTETMDALAGEALRRDPALFVPLAGGRAGIGGVYDTWRRTVAAVTGRPFRAGHGRKD